MREIPRGGLIGRSCQLWQKFRALHISTLGASAGFFLVLSVFPGLVLLLGLLRLAGLDVEDLASLLYGVMPGAFLELAEEVILLTYDRLTASVVGVSAVTALWSASRGMYGLLTGLNAVYGLRETRGYFRRRLLSVGYTFAFLLMVVLTLGLQVFGRHLAGLQMRFFQFLTQAAFARFAILLATQSLVFAAMYAALPNHRARLGQCLPGALCASLGWQLFSQGYSLYVRHAGGLSQVYGSIYVLALGMLWLYLGICIFFFGGLLNHALKEV